MLVGGGRRKGDERPLKVGAHLLAKRRDLGWTRKYAAIRLSLSEAELLAFERGEPMLAGQYRRVMRVYNRAWTRVTQAGTR